MKNKITLDTLTTSVFDAIESGGGKVYIVGGTVRNLYINEQVDYHDIDVEVYHLSLVELQKILSQFGTVNEVGKSFGILKVSCLPTIDFALPRQEVNIGNKHTDFEVIVDQDMDMKIASSRRDITMNAMLYEYQTGRILDFYHGKEDIDQGIIRMVNKESFKEDPLRVLRIARFVAKYQFDVEKETKLFCKEMVERKLLDSLSSERIYEEYCKILMSSRPSHGFEFLNDMQALPKYLEDLKNTMQRLDYHPEGNVWNHTMLVVDLGALVKQKTSDPLSFMWSCLLHDIGKPETTTEKGSAPKHQLIGADVFRENCTTLIRSKTMQKYIITMIKYHMELMNMARNKARDRVYYRVLHKIDGIFPLEDLLLLTKCDKLGRLKDGSEDIKLLESYIQDKVEKLGKEALIPCIDGEVLISLVYQPTTQFSKILYDEYKMQKNGK
ncbi:MAG: CCA tRNA nucleotidyltransferase [Coprobacillaceae bacterium]